MIRILANDGIHPDAVTLLNEAGYQVDDKKLSKEELIQFLPNYDVVIVRSATKIRRDLIDRCPNLKIIARAGVGLDNIDAAYARSKDITVMNTPDASSESVAELTFAHMFNLARSIHQANRIMPEQGVDFFKALKKTYSQGIELRGKNLGIIGFGRIGQSVARIGIALGMNILPVDLKVQEADIGIQVFNSEHVRLSVMVETAEFNDVLENSDFLTLHVPFPGGKPMIGREEINRMKDGAFLINTARGGAVDEAALLEAVESGKLGGAGLDVFENEPTPMPELMNHPRISVTPHIGAGTLEAQLRIGQELADQIIHFFGDDQ
jgi:D-3-phosphoglycerate dehydrogenase